MKRIVVVCASLASLSLVLGASARESVNLPGSACEFYSGTPASDNIFSRSGGNGFLHNTSAAAAKVECAVTWDASASSDKVRVWELDAQGTSGWDITKCNLYGTTLTGGVAFPTTSNVLTNPISGWTRLKGSVSPGRNMGTNQMAIVCSIPAGAAVVTYFTEID